MSNGADPSLHACRVPMLHGDRAVTKNVDHTSKQHEELSATLWRPGRNVICRLYLYSIHVQRSIPVRNLCWSIRHDTGCYEYEADARTEARGFHLRLNPM
jgi:hypothetical protein